MTNPRWLDTWVALSTTPVLERVKPSRVFLGSISVALLGHFPKHQLAIKAIIHFCNYLRNKHNNLL